MRLLCRTKSLLTALKSLQLLITTKQPRKPKLNQQWHNQHLLHSITLLNLSQCVLNLSRKRKLLIAYKRYLSVKPHALVRQSLRQCLVNLVLIRVNTINQKSQALSSNSLNISKLLVINSKQHLVYKLKHIA